MPVPAIELRPRGAVALFDAATRLCAHSSGLWALTLTGGAAVTWALLQLSDALFHRRPVLIPAALFALAWILRGLFQAAACHHLDGLLLGVQAPGVRASVRAALGRLPSVVITAAWLPVFNLLCIGLTAGIGYFLFASHLAAWAVVMKGKGHPLALYGTCARMLGPARSSLVGVRMLFWVSALVGLNLHLGANVLIYLGRKLIGLDLTYAQRFVSLDNGEWVLVVCALTFTLFEPLRAAIATLLLIDGRVRQEGLDLLAAVEQLPARKVAAALLALFVFALGAPSPAWALPRAGPVAASGQTEATAAAQKAREILARPEFSQPPVIDDAEDEEGMSLWARLKHSFMAWLRNLKQQVREPNRAQSGLAAWSGGAAAKLLVVVLIGAVLVLLTVVLAKLLRGKVEQKSSAEILSEGSAGEGIQDAQSALSRPPEGWARLADELAARGEFRAAVRSLYLALLSRLHHLGAIDYDPTLSNWDYCRQLRGHREWVRPFRELTLRFDFAWYGHFEVDSQGYLAFRELTRPILQPASEAAPPAEEGARRA